MKRVYVVRGLDLGWDCVMAVYDFDTTILEELQEEFPEDQHVISEFTINTSI